MDGGGPTYDELLARVALLEQQRHREQDVSRQATDAQRSVSDELRRTLDTAATGLTHCSRDLRYVSANAAYARWIELPVEQIVGRLIVDVMGWAAFDVIRPRVERVLRGERVEYEDELPIAGVLKSIHVVYTPDVDAVGNVVGWVASVTDVSKLKLAEKALRELSTSLEQRVAERTAALRESEERLRLAQVNAGAGVWDWHAKTGIPEPRGPTVNAHLGDSEEASDAGPAPTTKAE